MPDVSPDSEDTLVQSLKERMQPLIISALSQPEIKGAIKSPNLVETLIVETQRNAEKILQTTNVEIAAIRKAQQALITHQGLTPDAPDASLVRRAKILTFVGLTLLICDIGLSVELATSSHLPAYLFFGGIVAGLVSFMVAWRAVAGSAAIMKPQTYERGEIFSSGLSFLFSLLPSVIAILLIVTLWDVLKSQAAPVRTLIIAALILLGVICQLATTVWIPGTRYLYVGSRDRRKVMKQFGATAAWPVILNTLQGVFPTVISAMFYSTNISQDISANDNEKRPPSWHSERQRLERSLSDALRDWELAVVRKGITPFLRNSINTITTPPFSLSRHIYDSSGLAQMSAQEYVVPTPAFNRYQRVVERLNDGIVGVAGPRGVGKTTLLGAYRSGLFLKAGEEQIVIFEAVPVAYEARDFILHLYSQVCSGVIAFTDKHAPRRSDPARRARSRNRRSVLKYLLLLAVIWLPILRYVDILHSNPHFKLPIWFVRSGWLLALGFGLSIVLIVSQRRERHDRPPEPETVEAFDLRSLRELARSKIMSLRFQQTRTYGWGGKIGMPIPYTSELSKSHEFELVAKALTYPEIIADFQKFILTTVKIVKSVPNLGRVPIIIILDELDKISSLDSVRDFINEAKGFARIGSSGVLCLISVSEDALISFEERGLPARDSLDSAFDTVLEIEHLSLQDSIQLLNRRVIGMSPPFVCLCHCLAGGLPRELIRVARSVVDAQSTTLEGICLELIRSDLKGKVASWRASIVKSATNNVNKADFVAFINTYVTGKVTSSDLLSAVKAPPKFANAVDGIDNFEARAKELQEQVLAYLYFCATVLEVFSQDLTQEQVIIATKTGRPGSFDVLASVRQEFSVSPRIAWLTLNRFREAWPLSTFEYPKLAE